MRSTGKSSLFLLLFPLLAYAQTVVYSTDSYGNVYTSTVYNTGTTTTSDTYSTTSTDSTSSSEYASSTMYTSYTTGSTNDGVTTTDYSATTSALAIQTVPYTGQSLLVGTCAIAQFTLLPFSNGGSIEVPLVGCSDQRPECCPSLNFGSSGPGETESASSSATESSTTSWTGTTPSPTPTGVLSMLSKAPLTVCPSDMTDIDPVCCPTGFSKYGQVLLGGYPPVVFALGLPCADDDNGDENTHLSTGAKAGIGAGVGVAGLLIIGFFWACLAVRHRRRAKMKKLEAANTAAGGPVRPESGAYAATQADPKHISVATTMTPGMGSPMMQQHQQPYGMPPHGFSPAFGYGVPQPMMQTDAYGHPYGIQPIPQGYPGMNTYPPSHSPPPPFYPSGAYEQARYKQPAEVAGDQVRPIATGRESAQYGSDTRSQVTSSTGVTGSHHGPEAKPPAELSSQSTRR